MKTVSACLGLAVLLLIGALLFQLRKASEVNASLHALAKDHETVQKDVRTLSKRLSEIQSATSSSAVAGVPPSAGVASSPVVPPEPIVPVERPGVTIKAPEDWFKNGAKPGSYVVGVDSNETWGGMPSAYVQSLTPNVAEGFGGMMQTASAENYIGKRVRLSGWIKTQEANEGGGHLWLRVDGQESGRALQFDNMNNRAVKGNSDWQEASVVLDVPAGASALAYGFFVQGGGKMWVSGQKIEEVGPDVPSTNINMQKSTPKKLPTAPRNLGFSPGASK